MKYKGFFKHVNDKPTDDYIEVFVSDWNKDYWGFYAYICKDNYEQDIEDINKLITELNYRDGDVYVELIDYSGDTEGLYQWVSNSNTYTHQPIFNTELWEILEEKGNDFFLYFNKLNGGTYISDLQSAEYTTFNDWYEVLETYNPDLYKCLDESNGLGCFDIEHFFNCQGFTEIDDCIVSEG